MPHKSRREASHGNEATPSAGTSICGDSRTSAADGVGISARDGTTVGISTAATPRSSIFSDEGADYAPAHLAANDILMPTTPPRAPRQLVAPGAPQRRRERRVIHREDADNDSEIVELYENRIRLPVARNLLEEFEKVAAAPSTPQRSADITSSFTVSFAPDNTILEPKSKRKRRGSNAESVASTASLPMAISPLRQAGPASEQQQQQNFTPQFSSPGQHSKLSLQVCDAADDKEFSAGLKARIVLQSTAEDVLVPSALRARVMSITTAGSPSHRAHALQRASSIELQKASTMERQQGAGAELRRSQRRLRGSPASSSGSGHYDAASLRQELPVHIGTDIVAFPLTSRTDVKPEEGDVAHIEEPPTFLTPSKRRRPTASEVLTSDDTAETELPPPLPTTDEIVKLIMTQLGDVGAANKSASSVAHAQSLLQPQCALLLKIFEALDHAVLLHRLRKSGGRGNASSGSGSTVLPTMEVLKPTVESYSHHSFELRHLLQIAGIAKQAYKLHAALVDEKGQPVGNESLPSSAIMAAKSHASSRSPGTVRVVLEMDPQFAALASTVDAADCAMTTRATSKTTTSPAGSTRAARLVSAATSVIASTSPSRAAPSSDSEKAADASTNRQERLERALAFHAAHPESSLLPRRHFFLAHLLAPLHLAHAIHLFSQGLPSGIAASVAYTKENGGWHPTFRAADVPLESIALADVSPLFTQRTEAAAPALPSGDATSAVIPSTTSNDELSAAVAMSSTDAVRERRKEAARTLHSWGASTAGSKPTSTAATESSVSGVSTPIISSDCRVSSVHPDLAGLPAHIVERARQLEERNKVLLARQRPKILHADSSAADVASAAVCGVVSGLNTSVISQPGTATQFAECVAAQFLHAGKSAMLVKHLVPKIRTSLGISLSDSDISACISDLCVLLPDWISLQSLSAGNNCRLNRQIGIAAVRQAILAQLSPTSGTV